MQTLSPFARRQFCTGGILMNGLAKLVVAITLSCMFATAADQASVEAVHASQDAPLKTDPNSSFWARARPVFMEKDIQGKTVAGYRSEVRTRWTKDNLYLLFICPYEQLYLNPAPNTAQETNQ